MARSSVNLPVHTSAPCQFLSLITSCATLSLPHSWFPTHLSYTAALLQPSALLVPRASLLQTVPGQLDLMVSACAVGVGCCFAAPVGGKSHFLPTHFLSMTWKGGLGGCHSFGVEGGTY